MPSMKMIINKADFACDFKYSSSHRPWEFHCRMRGYEEAPLHILQALYPQDYGYKIYLKDENNRFGLPAFKVLGASWAVWRLLETRFGVGWGDWESFDNLRSIVSRLPIKKLVSATDGNHGRGVARIANILGLQAEIFMPHGAAEERIAGIASEGAKVVVVDGNYDEAVRQAQTLREEGVFVIQDTSCEGQDEEINRWIIEGYHTIFEEIRVQCEEPADIVFVQIGVGSLAAAAVQYYKGIIKSGTLIVGVEPERAACAYESSNAGKIVTLPGEQNSIMAGLNCGTVSSTAWPYLKGGIDAFITIEDDCAREAMRRLAKMGLSTSESGSAGAAGLLALTESSGIDAFRKEFGLKPDCRILLLMTEGVTDSEGYRMIVGQE